MADWTYHQSVQAPPDPEARKSARHLYGFVARMLVEGGHKDPEDRSKFLRTSRGTPRKPKSIEYYPGEFVHEPDPNLSDVSSTGVLVCHMVRRGWSEAQILSALVNPQNAGGAFLRWEASRTEDGGRGFISRLVAGSYRASRRNESVPMSLPEMNESLAALAHTPYTSPLDVGIGGMDLPAPVWRTAENGFELRRAEALKFLAAVTGREEAERTKTALTKRGPVAGRVAWCYLDALVLHGLVDVTKQRVQTGRGKRECDVVTLAQEAPKEFVDRRLWEQAREFAGDQQVDPLSAEAVAALAHLL